MRSTNFERLKEYILKNSIADNFYIASREWYVVKIFISDDPTQCPCGQVIYEWCHIKNRETGGQTIVGNVCVKHFLGIDMSTFFTSAKRLKKNRSKGPNKTLVSYASQYGLINEWETDFLTNVMNKRVLSDRQIACRDKISKRILVALTAQMGEQ